MDLGRREAVLDTFPWAQVRGLPQLFGWSKHSGLTLASARRLELTRD